MRSHIVVVVSLTVATFVLLHLLGGGYPNRVAGADIPLGARIFAVVDVLDALVATARTATG